MYFVKNMSFWEVWLKTDSIAVSNAIFYMGQHVAKLIFRHFKENNCVGTSSRLHTSKTHSNSVIQALGVSKNYSKSLANYLNTVYSTVCVYMNAFYACILCMYSMYVLYVFIRCMYSMYVFYVCTLPMYVFYVCILCILCILY